VNVDIALEDHCVKDSSRVWLWNGAIDIADYDAMVVIPKKDICFGPCDEWIIVVKKGIPNQVFAVKQVHPHSFKGVGRWLESPSLDDSAAGLLETVK
jgi:hypothetical protein